MDKIVKIGFPMEYEDDNHIIRTGMWLKENEVKALEKRLNKYNHLQSKIDKVIDKLESLLPMCIMPNNMLIHGTEKAKVIEEALDILKEDK